MGKEKKLTGLNPDAPVPQVWPPPRVHALNAIEPEVLLDQLNALIRQVEDVRTVMLRMRGALLGQPVELPKEERAKRAGFNPMKVRGRRTGLGPNVKQMILANGPMTREQIEAELRVRGVEFSKGALSGVLRDRYEYLGGLWHVIQ